MNCYFSLSRCSLFMPTKILTASRLHNWPSLLTAADNCHRCATPSDMLNRGYFDQTLRRHIGRLDLTEDFALVSKQDDAPLALHAPG
jgi:hypothetical protein